MGNATQRVDILDRQQFVEDVVRIVRQLSANKKNTTFAINGAWGVGKTFVLDMLEEQLKDDFIVFHYNAWEYDYYDEPLVALLTSTIKQIEEMMKNEIAAKKVDKAVLKKVKNALVGFVGEISRNKLGVDIPKLIKEISEDASNQTKASKAYNPYLDITEAIDRVKAQLSKMSERAPIVFVVDELDRCLPEYAIKVLERLHHVLSGINDLQVILSVDKVQVEKTVKTIFGDKTDVDHYLQKFIRFTIDLPIGSINAERWFERFTEYRTRFDNSELLVIQEHLNDFIDNLLKPYDIRTRIRFIEKAEQVHELLLKADRPYEVSFMCLEIFIVVAHYEKLFDWMQDSGKKPIEDPFNVFFASPCLKCLFDRKIISEFVGYYSKHKSERGFEDIPVSINIVNVWSLLWYVTCCLFGDKLLSKPLFHLGELQLLDYPPVEVFCNYAKEYLEMCSFVR